MKIVVYDRSKYSGDKYTDGLIQNIVELARISSSGGHVYKGTQGQAGAKAFVVRSCFAFSSVVEGTSTYQDETRITSLRLAKPDDYTMEDKEKSRKHFNELMQLLTENLTDEFINGLRVRVINNVHTLLRNISTFTDAVAMHLGSRRTADQLGPLLAGAYLIHSVDAITPAAALKWIKDRDWGSHVQEESSKNENMLLNKLAYHRINVQSDGKNYGNVTISELIAVALQRKTTSFSEDVAEEHLKRYGFRTKTIFSPGETIKGVKINQEDWDDGVYISNTAPAIANILQGTPWTKKWGPQLLAIKGKVKTVPKSMHFIGMPTRASWVPLELIWNEKPTREDDENEPITF